MFRVGSMLFIFCAGLMVAFYAQKQIHAQTIAEAMAIPPPEPIEVIVAPAGTINCFKIKEGWFRGKWVTEHRICQYQNDKRGMAWVEGHWTCYKYDNGGACMTWKMWSSGWDKIHAISKSRTSKRWLYSPRESYTYFYPCVY